jgi:hypothetical protein
MVAYPGATPQGTWLMLGVYTDSACTTSVGATYYQTGVCVTSGYPTSTAFGMGVPSSINVTWDGTTLTACLDYGSYTCAGTLAGCVPFSTASCTSQGFVYTRTQTVTGTFMSSTSYNTSTCGGLPAGPGYEIVGQCQSLGTTSIKTTGGGSSYTRCNYTDNACANSDYCVTCSVGACCTDPAFGPHTSIRVNGVSAVAPSLLVLAAAVLAALAF